jgi:hypothetical protein
VLLSSKILGKYNPPAGTLIESRVVHDKAVHRMKNTAFDFFLVSHSVPQGAYHCTVVIQNPNFGASNTGAISPVHYWVAYGSPPSPSSPIRKDILPQLTFRLAHLYFNWPGIYKCG